MANESQSRDLILAPGEYAYVLDTTKGQVNVVVGPMKISMSNTDVPVMWNTEKRRFIRIENIPQATLIDSIAPEGFYIALFNPADTHPTTGTMTTAPKMQIGHRVNIPGPVNFALWPGQFASVIRGHHLHSNQYLLAQVYNDLEATANWKEAVLKPQGEEAPAIQAPRSFNPGQLLIIKGTEVAFFIPPTGIKVVPEGGEGKFVRDAVTLERLEYCILLDEDGNKRFVQGPDVVFPEPTEQFVEKDGNRKFRAIELNETTGIYVKVIADYEEANGTKRAAGDELFITGKEQAIYIQREEHSVIRYGDQTKHYAVAVPSGEGRYVLNRSTGVVSLVRGPRMLLCDPRTEVIILRTLSEQAIGLMYPGNAKVLQINKEREQANVATAVATGATQYQASLTNAMPTGARGLAALNYQDEMAVMKSRQIVGDTFQRGTAFTPPRTITLDTKYDGAVAVNVWTGYAVLIVNKTGSRRVVIGPSNILLEYDETLAPLELSTGKPKNTEKLYRTVYLRVHNNRVSDFVNVETKDLVRLQLHVAYRVNFEGDASKWFEVENYVRLLTDHMRSLIRNVAKRTNIEQFYAGTIDIVRDAVLGTAVETGKPRPGRAFDENNMRIYDLELLDVKIENPGVAQLLANAQMMALKSTVEVNSAEQNLLFTKRLEALKRAEAVEKADTVEQLAEAQNRETTATFALQLAKVKAEMEIESGKLQEQRAQQEVRKALTDAELARERAKADQAAEILTRQVDIELKRIIGETAEIVKRAEAVDDKLATALTAFSDQKLIGEIATALGPMAAMSGVSAADVLAKLLAGTPFEGVMKSLGARTRMPMATK